MANVLGADVDVLAVMNLLLKRIEDLPPDYKVEVKPVDYTSYFSMMERIKRKRSEKFAQQADVFASYIAIARNDKSPVVTTDDVELAVKLLDVGHVPSA